MVCVLCNNCADKKRGFCTSRPDVLVGRIHLGPHCIAKKRGVSLSALFFRLLAPTSHLAKTDLVSNATLSGG